jgi:hypothetical protein
MPISFLLSANSRKPFPLQITELVSSGNVRKLSTMKVNGLSAISSLQDMKKPHVLP